ncbi:unnamed protein product [Bursaphelenchus xylophilus]|uniref:(pine wood nematode) hypothetical protein n=1 Tax=Bursaphelenchus xylophilus TaxID=6326 RepID=A0A1I7SF15_BURXY|nr:unnamed protein product [Bursaphelenchus xylophilus]CAG9088857.1 unnamed protein product [Bursaphelenchus xylophilus]
MAQTADTWDFRPYLKNMPSTSAKNFSAFDPNCMKKERFVRIMDVKVTSRERKIENDKDDGLLTALTRNWDKSNIKDKPKEETTPPAEARPGPSHRRQAHEQPTTASPPEAKHRRAS